MKRNLFPVWWILDQNRRPPRTIDPRSNTRAARRLILDRSQFRTRGLWDGIAAERSSTNRIPTANQRRFQFLIVQRQLISNQLGPRVHTYTHARARTYIPIVSRRNAARIIPSDSWNYRRSRPITGWLIRVSKNSLIERRKRVLASDQPSTL